MRQTAIQFDSEGVAIEGVLSTPEPLSDDCGIVIACHPHPMLGGDMDNSLILAICSALNRRGIASLRFNFRSVGGSAADFSNGVLEGNDLAAAAKAMRRWPGLNGRKLAVVGYSFGAGVALRHLRRLGKVRGIVLVAPPVSSTACLARRWRRPSALCVAGTRDGISPPQMLRDQLIKTGVDLVEIEEADHSFAGCEERVGELATDFLADRLA